jgi:O-antigen/teichoic acid export membrane protein
LRRTDGRIRGQVLWGLVDQGCMSAVNFGLTVAAARLLGPAGLGEVFVGFTFYLLALSLQRALIADPLVVTSAALAPDERQRATRAATTVTVALASGLVVVTGAVGLFLPAGLGRGLGLFAPWIPAALLHDLFRMVLFRDQRGAQAAGNTVASLIVTVAAMAVSWNFQDGWAVVGSWALGGVVGAALGLARTRAWPARPSEAWRWWRERAWPLGRWLGAESVINNARLQLTSLLLGGLLGTGDLGGLRAADSLFGLMTLVGPGLAMVGLPAVVRALEASVAGALALAARIGGVALAIVAVYLFGVGSVRSDLMGLLFGSQFVGFADLVIPIGVAQLFGAGVLGFSLFLKACSAGRALMWYQLVYSVAALALSVGMAVRYGVQGAAWGLAGAGLACAILMVFLTLRVAAGHVRQPPRMLAPPGKLQ